MSSYQKGDMGPPCGTLHGAAEKLAAAEGLVTHLKSLVVVDETVQADATLPTTVKIQLADPRTATLGKVF